VTAASQLTAAWQQLHRPADLPVPASNAPEPPSSTVPASSSLAGPA
jgi:hypothetical protein